MKSLKDQIGGTHYSKLAIQPVEYIHANDIPFIEGSIIKYATRWRDKGGIQDLKKIIHFAELLIDLETKVQGEAPLFDTVTVNAFDESRIDVIGQNGGTGEHYED